MSLIYGLLSFKLANPLPYLKAIEGGLSVIKHDARAYWHKENVGLGHNLRYDTPESLLEKLPYTLGPYTITANARLDNRGELFKLLNLCQAHGAEIPDGLLILKAYQKWKENCVSYLKGDWAFAIWDEESQQLFIARDQLGNTGIYYYKSAGFFVFSSSIKGILAINEVEKTPNELFVVGILTLCPSNFSHTAYNNIYALEPGHTLRLKDGRLSKERYYVLAPARIHAYKNPEDYISSFLELYTKAVNVRLRAAGKIGAMLSGGLDSGSVSALAALRLKQQNTRLPVYTSVPLYNTDNLTTAKRFGNEASFAQDTVSFNGNMDINLIDAKDVSVLEGISQYLQIHNSPGHASPNYYWMVSLFQTARQQGVANLLTGQGGNASVSWTGMPLAESFPDAFALYRSGEIPALALIKKLIKFVLPEPAINWYRNYNTNYGYWKEFTPLHPCIAKKLNIEKLMKESGFNPNFFPHKDPVKQRYSIINPESSLLGNLWQDIGFAFNLNITDPTRDLALSEFCLAIPDKLYRDRENNRLIIRKAMKGILPDRVRLNKLRGLQGADNQHRVKDCYNEIQHTLHLFEKSSLVTQWLDISKMKTVLNNIYTNVDIKHNVECSSVLLRGVSVGLFLLRFDKQ